METWHAWYTIGVPSPAYAKIFKGFRLAHELTYVLLSSCLQDHQVTVSTFKDKIRMEYPPEVAQSLEDTLRDDEVYSQFAADVCGIDDS